MKNYYFTVTIREECSIRARNKKAALKSLKESYKEGDHNIELEDYEIKYTGCDKK